MKKASRIFLKYRPNAIFRTVRSIKMEGALPNHCWQNSSKFATDNPKFGVLSGWIVGDFFGAKGTAIIPHYWIENRETLEQFDPTPHTGGYSQNYDYIEDLEIFKFGSNDNYLPAPINMASDGTLKAVDNDGYLVSLDQFSLKKLFEISAS